MHAPGTLLELSVDATKIRYEAADTETTPTRSSTQYTDPLDLIYQEASVTVSATCCTCRRQQRATATSPRRGD